MQRAVVWAAGAILTIGGVLAGFLAEKWHREISSVCDDVPCDHFKIRLRAIKSQIEQARHGTSYLQIGDSVTELALLPDICNVKPLNAGIGSATSRTFAHLAKELVVAAKPRFVVLELGTNDALLNRSEGFENRMQEIVSELSPLPVVIVPLPPSRAVADSRSLNAALSRVPGIHVPTLSEVENVADGVHLTPADYIGWKRLIVEASSLAICPT